MSDRPTPETDTETMRDEYDHVDSDFGPFAPSDTVPADFARRLERERDEAREALRTLAEHGESEIQKLIKECDEAKNKLADALQEVDLRTLDYERMKQERDEVREDATNYYAKIGELIDNCKDAQYESEQQSRLLGISAERECALRGKIFELERKILQLEAK